MEKNQKNATWFKNLSDIDKNTIARLRKDDTRQGDSKPNLRTFSVLNEIFRKNVRDVSDNRNIFKTMPKLIFPRKILVSAIASPGDLSQTSLIVENGLNLSDYSLTAQFTKVIQDFVDTELNLVERVHEIIDTALVLEGAKPIMLLPNSAIDNLIGISTNGYTTESKSSDMIDGWYKPMGLLNIPHTDGTGKATYSFENARPGVNTHNAAAHTITMKVTDGKEKTGKNLTLPIMITDNIEVLGGYISDTVNRALPKDDLYADSALSFESKKKGGKKEQLTEGDIYRMLFKSTRDKTSDRGIEVIPPPVDYDLTNSLGNPVEFRLSKDSVIPIGLPGEKGNHSRYILIIGKNGFPVSTSSKMDYYADIRRANSGVSNLGDGPSSVAGAMVASAADAMGVTNASELSDTLIDTMANIHSDLVISDLLPRIRSSMGDEEIEIGMTDATAKLMLARTMKNQHTTLLYVPAEYMVYFAFEYDEVGVGKSILDDAKALIGLTAVLTVANVMGSVENAIPGKNINLKMDEEDGDVLNSATFMAREAMSLANRRFPSGSASISGIAEELQMASTSITIEGHPKFPDVQASVMAKESHQNPVDTDLMNGLVDDINMLFFVTPEITGSASGQADFATTVVNNSIMLLKAVIEKQGIANKHFSHYLRTYCKYSGVIVKRLYSLAEKNKKDIPKTYNGDVDKFIKDYVENVILKLPSPVNDNLDNRMNKFTSLAGHLDTIIDVHVNAESLVSEGYSLETINQILPIMKAAYKNHVLRQYSRDTSLMPEFDLFVPGDDEIPTVDLTVDIASHSSNLLRSVKGFLEKVKISLGNSDIPAITKLDEANREKAAKVSGSEEEPNEGEVPLEEEEVQTEGGEDLEEDVSTPVEGEGTPEEEGEDPMAVSDLPSKDLDLEENDDLEQ